MNDYTLAIYRAVCCKTVTTGSTMHIDDFGDIWTLTPALNRCGEQSVYRQYSGNLVISGHPLPSNINGNHLYIGQLIPTYHFNISNPSPFINGLQQQVGYYLQNRLLKIMARYNKKPLSFMG